MDNFVSSFPSLWTGFASQRILRQRVSDSINCWIAFRELWYRSCNAKRVRSIKKKNRQSMKALTRNSSLASNLSLLLHFSSTRKCYGMRVCVWTATREILRQARAWITWTACHNSSYRVNCSSGSWAPAQHHVWRSLRKQKMKINIKIRHQTLVPLEPLELSPLSHINPRKKAPARGLPRLLFLRRNYYIPIFILYLVFFVRIDTLGQFDPGITKK